VSTFETTSSETEYLGPKVVGFRASTLGQVARFFLGWICIAVGAAFLLVCVLALNRVAGMPWHMMHSAVYGVLFLAGGIALNCSVRNAAQARCDVYELGLLLRQQSSVQMCRWDEIIELVEKEAVNVEEVIGEGMRSESRAFHLRLRTGQVVVLKSYLRGLAKIGATVKRETLPLLLPAYQEMLRRGQKVEFGPIRLAQHDICVDAERRLWGELDRMRRNRGWLMFYCRGEWLAWKKVKVSAVPNAHVMVHLVGAHCTV
jgi:hypothetical protein